MKYLVFTSQATAERRNEKAFTEGTGLYVFPDGTTQYATIYQHPKQELYALPVDSRYHFLFTSAELQQANTLTIDWFTA